jgi:Mn-dependent transcriptional regulator
MHKSGEDYLEAILQLSLETGSEEVRITDIAKKLGVAKSSVSRAVGNLKAEGYVTQELYSDVILTAKGKVEAGSVYHRHTALLSFFADILGVERTLAEHDACLVEHDISSETMEKLVAFISAYGGKN